ncbi:type II toxin-antitoxin system RelE family toxin [Parasphaerochaeta coccoides]|uniref:Addiction module toxin, RelE/StbE family n=1 Tax=Parasphaerochaeta coccoides (strain ATCC BAA-1237 / DSM 17374 / SPN1) TaxID=760011 RepID=F4GJZ8_PARC1|nr:type II toxin-antitoxin system RelE/ParE family toxin [Parasphaerochaeta coccoides]AEC01423.1 addiction module toxin, RelE/StbE family [Parasphaerochaeta coccoides DSM 17374]
MYSIELEDKAVKAMKSLDRQISYIIYRWIEKNLSGCENPRLHGKALTGNKKSFWRYRVGAYRLIATIDSKSMIIFISDVAHRREVYDR